MGLTEKNGIDREKWENKIDSETRARREKVQESKGHNDPNPQKNIFARVLGWGQFLG